jgi:hypothetical protein
MFGESVVRYRLSLGWVKRAGRFGRFSGEPSRKRTSRLSPMGPTDAPWTLSPRLRLGATADGGGADSQCGTNLRHRVVSSKHVTKHLAIDAGRGSADVLTVRLRRLLTGPLPF